jgi:SUKH-4 immunity protein
MSVSVGNCHRHYLGASEPEGLDTETISFLRTEGIPAELRLRSWAGPRVGPTLFTSELAGGMLNRNVAGEWVLGTIRETQGSAIALAEFVIRGAQVVLVDNHTEWRVNRSVATFVSSMEAFHSAFAALPVGTEAGISVLAASRRIDLEAFNAPDGYWSMWVEEFGGD